MTNEKSNNTSSPVLKSSTMTKRERKIRKKYTLFQPERNNGLYLVVDQQSFAILQGCDKATTKWFQDRLAVALTRMIDKETP